MTLIEILVYLGISLVVVFAAFSLLKVSSSMQNVSVTFNSLQDARSMILEKLKSKVAFDNSLAYGPNSSAFNCIKTQTSCPAAGGDFTLLDEQNKQVHGAARHNVPTEGLDPRGGICNNFDAVNGNPMCPYRFRVYWVPRCTGACINPVVELRAELLYKPGPVPDQQNTINTTAYNIVYVKSDVTAKLQQTCESSGGTVQADGTCRRNFQSDCLEGEYLIGFEANGQKICRAIGGHRCPDGQVLLGVDGNGVAQCGPGCSDPGFSGGSIW